MKASPSLTIEALRAQFTNHAAACSAPAIRTGLAAVDAALPGGGLARAGLHEVAGRGPEVEHGGAGALFVAGLMARLRSPAGTAKQPQDAQVLWVSQQRDLFAPALAAVGLHPDRVIYAEAPRPAGVLLALEDALHHRGLAGVVGELSGRFSLTASRRLQLASEAVGTPVFVLRRSRCHDDPLLAEPCAALTRWRISPVPAPPHPNGVPGLARARWQLDLVRCRGGEPYSWIVEACDAQGRLGFPAELSHRPAAQNPGQVRAAVG